ncbi:hypothetical protein HOLleu_35603 [Holothuria leucospilota]|uniref:Uncharacterized protein n=1 Tax=Holothuria leucospilota TaxID=206669 RepID=A0A9Q0YIP6_HOLLE|nr:hypothetical protein HOLleu_35603 [Holothuria leucospilota]
MWQTDPVLYRKGTMNDRRKVKAQKQSTFNITILMEARTWLALKVPTVLYSLPCKEGGPSFWHPCFLYYWSFFSETSPHFYLVRTWK